MRNLNKPPRYIVASIQAQQTMGGDVMQSDDNGQYVEWRDYKWLLDSYAFVRDQWNDLDAEVERLQAVSTIEQRTIQGLQQTPEWSEIARLTAYCRELEGKVSHIDLFKSVVEKFFNSSDLKNSPDAQSCYALAEKLKQLPDSILDFTEEQVRDNPAWALAVFRHKVKEMQYKRIHDINAIGGEQEENARLKSEVESVRQVAQDNKTETEATRIENARLHSLFANSEQENARLNNYIERLEVRIAVLVPENARLKAMDSLKTVSLTDSTNWQAIGDYAETKEENALLKAEVERLEPELEQRCRELNLSIAQQAIQLRQIGELKAEVERLTFDPLAYLDDHGEWMPRQTHLAAVERLEVRNAELVPENARLKAEVERLRKAGDELERVLVSRSGSYEAGNASHEWNAAKEGKPSV